eukprot:s2560_g4.t1
MGRLLLGHEDQMGVNDKSEHFIMFFRKGSKFSLVNRFIRKSEHWHELRDQISFQDQLALANQLQVPWTAAMQSILQRMLAEPIYQMPLCPWASRSAIVSWPPFLPEPTARVALIVEGLLTMQRLIYSWSNQAFDGATALFCEPRLLAVQVNRFCADGHDAVGKDVTSIFPDPRIFVPVFLCCFRQLRFCISHKALHL